MICPALVKFPLFRIVGFARRQPCFILTHQKNENFPACRVAEFSQSKFFVRQGKSTGNTDCIREHFDAELRQICLCKPYHVPLANAEIFELSLLEKTSFYFLMKRRFSVTPIAENRLFYLISCSRLSNSDVLKNSPNVISKPSHNFLSVTSEISLRRLSIILYTVDGVTPDIVASLLSLISLFLHNS